MSVKSCGVGDDEGDFARQVTDYEPYENAWANVSERSERVIESLREIACAHYGQ